MSDNHWPNPLELQDIKDAVDARKHRHMVGDKLFNFTYQQKTFHVKPVEGFIPCGYFEYEHAFDDILIKDQDS